MNCDQIRERLADYLGGELDEPQRSDFDAHVAECAPCREYVHGLRESVAAVEALRLPQAVALTRAAAIPVPSVARHPRVFLAAILRYAAVILTAFAAGYFSRGSAENPPNTVDAKPQPMIAAGESIHPEIAQNYQRVATQHPGASTLGLSLLSIARR